MKKWIYSLVSIAAAVFLYLHRREIWQIATITNGAKIHWVITAILAQLVVYYFATTAHKYSLSVTGVKRTRRQLLPLLLSALVINSTVPSAGTSGTVLFIEDAKKRGESGAKTGTGIFLAIITNFVALLAILTGSLIFLSIRNELGATELISTLILAGFVFITYALVWVAKDHPEKIRNFLKKANDLMFKVRRFFWHKAKHTTNWVDILTNELHDVSGSVHKEPDGVVLVVILFLAVHFFNIATLFALFHGFDIKVKAGVIIAGYAIGELFKTVSPAPEGIGVTEASMAVVFSSFGVAPLSATAIALIYRGLNFWIPFLIGFAILQYKHLRIADIVEKIRSKPTQLKK